MKSIADIMDAMQRAGAPFEAIKIAVAAIEDARNETQKHIDENRAAVRERVRKHRENKARNVTVTDCNLTGARHARVVNPSSSEPNGSSEGVANATSPEPEKSAPVAARLPVTSGPDFEILETDVVEWREAFPALDIRQQLNAMRAWLNANPTRRKTRRGVKRFVVSWLNKEQNRSRAPHPRQGQPPPVDAFQAELQRRAYGHEPDNRTTRHDDESNGPAGLASAPVVDLVAVSQGRGRQG